MKRKAPDDGDHYSPDLFCYESPSFLFDKQLDEDQDKDQEEVVDENRVYNHNLYDYYDPAMEEEQIQVLIHREINFGFNKNQALFEVPNWVKDARSDALAWTLRSFPVLGFHSRTAYLSMTYIDRSFCRQCPNIDHMHQSTRLIAVACLSLAAKMEEAERKEVKRPPPREFENEDYMFSSQRIKSTEFAVMETLDWRLNLITPFAFLDYFIRKLCQALPDVKSRIEGFVMSIIGEINIMHHRPSSIAAAATILALNQELTRELIELVINFNPGFEVLDSEDVITCYNIMQQQELKKLEPKEQPKSTAKPPDSPPTQLDPVDDVVDNSSVTSEK